MYVLLHTVWGFLEFFDYWLVSGFSSEPAKSNYRKGNVFFGGGVQILVPTVGYFAGFSFRDALIGTDHLIAFGLLAFIGSRMINDSTKKEDGKEEALKLHSVITLSVATSIDALMVGLSFAFLPTSVLEPILMIGLVTFPLSLMIFFFLVAV